MKIRNGFVSNSSASSFIVRHINALFDEKRPNGILNEKTIQKLIKYGFRATRLSHPSHLDNADYNDQSIWEELKDSCGNIITKNYGYWVQCNELDVIKFLVKNDIGFIANGHYGHVTYLFHKGDKDIMVFTNYGATVETYYYDEKWEEIIKKLEYNEPFSKISIKEVAKW